MIKRVLKKLARKKRVEKRVRKAKRSLYVLGLCCAFCAGATVSAILVYRNRQKLAVITLGKRNIKRRRLKRA